MGGGAGPGHDRSRHTQHRSAQVGGAQARLRQRLVQDSEGGRRYAGLELPVADHGGSPAEDVTGISDDPGAEHAPRENQGGGHGLRAGQGQHARRPPRARAVPAGLSTTKPRSRRLATKPANVALGTPSVEARRARVSPLDQLSASSTRRWLRRRPGLVLVGFIGREADRALRHDRRLPPAVLVPRAIGLRFAPTAPGRRRPGAHALGADRKAEDGVGGHARHRRGDGDRTDSAARNEHRGQGHPGGISGHRGLARHPGRTMRSRTGC